MNLCQVFFRGYNRYEPATVPVIVDDPQVFDNIVVSGKTMVIVVAEPAEAESPFGTSSHTTYMVITFPLSE